jgi:hypothetical protein
MPTTLGFKDIIDLPQWRPESPCLAVSGAGMSLVGDERNNSTRHPLMYFLRSATALDVYDPISGEWQPLASPALAGTFGNGAAAVFNPSAGPRGTLAAGATTTSVILSTALPAAVGNNQLANRGDSIGFRIRIIGNAAGSSGKIEERTIIANTAGTTPTITLDSALSFTPATGDAYEIIGGRVFMLGAGTTTAGIWKHYDITTNSFSGNLATTNLPATIGTESFLVSLSELHVSNDRSPGEGLVSGGATYNTSFDCIQATAASGTTITGSGMPSTLFANEYRNFQVRIVEDTVTPTSVGQRRRISTHTSGATGIFTVAAFAVTPSSSAKFVVENDDDKILLRSSAVATTFTYNITANAWDITTFGASGSACGAGTCGAQAFGITRDATGNARHSHIFFLRGAATSSIDLLDIAGAAAGSWSNAIAYGNNAQTFTTGTTGQYAPATFSGRYIHLIVNGTQRMIRFDVRNRVMESGTYLKFLQGAATSGGKISLATFVDGATKLDFIYVITNSQTFMFSCAIVR